jgi:hypothetical protein
VPFLDLAERESRKRPRLAISSRSPVEVQLFDALRSEADASLAGLQGDNFRIGVISRTRQLV